MLSFTPICDENLAVFGKDAEEILSAIYDPEGETEIAATRDGDCLLLRLFTYGRYAFAYPYELTDKADVPAAIEKILAYAIKEELPLVFTDVPAAALGDFLPGFRHAMIDAEDENAESYRVRVQTEPELLEEFPTASGERVTLSPLTEEDIPAYAELCRDEEVNRYYGYSLADDVKDPTDEAYFSAVQDEFARGAAITLAIRAGDDLLGDATLYAFDGRGRAEFSLRLAAKEWGKGYGTDAVLALLSLAADLGLSSLLGECLPENARSEKLLSRFGEPTKTERGTLAVTIAI